MTITVYTGPMFSSKSNSLIMEAKKAINLGKLIFAFKPSMDVRYGADKIISHDGLDFKKETGQDVIAIDIETKSLFNYVHNVKSEWHLPDTILVDEAQFFPNLVEDIEKIQDLAEIDFICCGLDCDSNGDSFGQMPELLAKADYVHKLKASCFVCGKEASKTFRRLMAPTDQKILIGGADLYEPRCRFHWKQGMEEKLSWLKV